MGIIRQEEKINVNIWEKTNKIIFANIATVLSIYFWLSQKRTFFSVDSKLIESSKYRIFLRDINIRTSLSGYEKVDKFIFFDFVT